MVWIDTFSARGIGEKLGALVNSLGVFLLSKAHAFSVVVAWIEGNQVNNKVVLITYA